MRLSRRSLLLGSVLAPIFGSLGGCSSVELPQAPTPILQVYRQVHVALPQTRTWTLEQQQKLVLQVAGKRYVLQRHTDETLGKFIKDPSNELLGTSRQPTHYVPDAEFSSVAVQLFNVGVPALEGQVSAQLFGIHVPPGDRSDLTDFEPTLGSVGNTWLGADNAVVGEDGFLSEDAVANARWLLFTKAGMMTQEPQLAQLILSLMDGAEFWELVRKIEQTAVFSYDQAANGDVAWMKQVYATDAAGNKIQRYDVFAQKPLTRTVERPDGSTTEEPLYATDFQLEPGVQTAMVNALRALERAVNDEPKLRGEGRMRPPLYSESTTHVPLSVAPEGGLLGSGSAEESPFEFPDNDMYRSYRRLKAHYKERQGAKDLLEVEAFNTSALTTCFTYHKFKEVGNDQERKLESQGSSVLTILPGVFFPTIRKSYAEEAKHDIEIPDETAEVRFYGHQMRLWFDRGNNAEYNDAYWLNWFFSLFVDILLPPVIAGFGAYWGRSGVFSWAHEGLLLLLEFSPELARLLMRLVAELVTGKNIGPALLETLVQGLLAAASAGLKRAISTLIAKLLELVGWLAVEGGVIASTPIIGQIALGIGVVQSAAQLVVALSHANVFGGEGRHDGTVRWTAQRVAQVQARIKPNVAKVAYFPERVTSAKVSFQPVRVDGKPVSHDFSLSDAATLTKLSEYTFAKLRLLNGGRYKCTVQLFNGKDLVGGGESTPFDAERADHTQTIDVAIDLKPVAIRASTVLRESRRFGMAASGTRVMQDRIASSDKRPPLWRGGASMTPQNISVSQRQGLVGYSFVTDFVAPVAARFPQGHLVSFLPEPPEGRPFARFSPTLGSGLHILLSKCGADHYAIRPSVVEDANYLALFASKFQGVEDMAAPVELPQDATQPDTSDLMRLRGHTILSAKLHPTREALMAITTDFNGRVRYESFAAIASKTPTYSENGLVGREIGHLLEPVALCGVPNQDAVMVLEQGSRRLQLLTVGGSSATSKTFFKGAATFVLPQDANVTYLDVEVDQNNNLWVLSSEGDSSSVVSVYAPDAVKGAKPIVTFREVNARAIAIDDGSTLYSVSNGAEFVVGTTYAEPTMSIWVPQNV